MICSNRCWMTLVLAGGLLIGGLIPGGSSAQGPDSTSGSDSTGTPGSRAFPSEETDSEAPYVPTRRAVVDRMLEVAGVDEDDTVVDLGSGDGRIVVRAAARFGARGRGYEIQALLVRAARERARRAEVSDRVEFRRKDLFDADLSDATVVMLYLTSELNLKLRSKLLDELRPGTRVVSHDFDMGDWRPEQTVHVNGERIFLWTVPDEIPAHLAK